MPPQRCPVTDEVRYSILHSLQLENKISTYISLEIEPRPGPVKYHTLPPDTVSEILRYRVKANGWVVVKAHQYRLPDGSIRGGPDPKYIRIDDAVFVSDSGQ